MNILQLTLKEQAVLLYLKENGGTVWNRISMAGIVSPTNYQLRDKLLEAKLIEEKSINKRARMVYLTPPGAELAKEILKVVDLK